MMKKIELTPYDMAARFKGIKEIKGPEHNAQIVAMLQRSVARIKRDEVAWCSAFVNYVCWLLDLPMTKHLRARSWLRMGRPVTRVTARRGWDVCIFTRAGATMDASIIDAPGHVGFFHSISKGGIYVLGGNQSNTVNIKPISAKRLLGIRRLGDE
jgi:uncharacterized protein (TIGR02594 family)